LAVSAAYLVDELGRMDDVPSPGLSDADPVLQTIAGQELSIPRRWFRYGEQIRDGFTDQINLRVIFPADTAHGTQPVDVTLLP
ncbi:hypothetical protein, partial [Pseudoxanthomonas sp. KAs_5_3]